MFQVKRKDNFEVVYTVYATKQNEHGIILFLVFTLGKWLWMPTDDFVPVDFS